mmetsp:Transcript_21360/g.33409  ORF Transcript_21360/g.33409 Transcript_21360/m.33409 type:complete len:96 (-) Transcript_21360:45-332(-)
MGQSIADGLPGRKGDLACLPNVVHRQLDAASLIVHDGHHRPWSTTCSPSLASCPHPRHTLLSPRCLRQLRTTADDAAKLRQEQMRTSADGQVRGS